MPEISTAIAQRLRKVTVVKWLVIAAAIAVLFALFIPGPQWASSGEIEIPVRVVVFDAAQAKPLQDAQVSLMWAPPLSDMESIADMPERLQSIEPTPTDRKGVALIPHRFWTGASDQRPVAHAHLSWVWVVVQAKGYGGVVVPVRHQSEPSAAVKKQGVLLVPVGLLPVSK